MRPMIVYFMISSWRILKPMDLIKPVSALFRGSLQEVFCKKMFLEISQNTQENTRARVSF